MMGRAPLKIVKAKYRASDKRKLIESCSEMGKFLNDVDDIEFHVHLEEIKALIRRAEGNAEVYYSSFRS